MAQNTTPAPTSASARAVDALLADPEHLRSTLTALVQRAVGALDTGARRLHDHGQRQHSRAADAAEEVGAVLIHGAETGKAGRSGRLTSTRTARNHP